MVRCFLFVSIMLAACGDDGGQCGHDPSPPATTDCPGQCTGGCESGLCKIDCAAAACESMTIACPDDRACAVTCHGLDACDTSTITCPSAHGCTLLCTDGVDACGDVSFQCQGGSCAIECDAAACVGTAVQCGAGPCTSTCLGDSAPTVECGSSCSCVECT